MRSVNGLERPALQWAFVMLGVLLVVLSAGEAAALRRARAQVEALRAANLDLRVERDGLDARAAREQSARESLSLELGRVRAGAAAVTQPTLTLSPLTRRGAQPPAPTVGAPPVNETIQLRLVLPPGAAAGANYSIIIRSWSGGDTIWSRGALTASSPDHRSMVMALVTGDVFAPGAYEVALRSNNADVASYEVAVRAADR